ncbi:hypothetical protein M404DRAFT_189202 [Pisolithus tinctorius Marx 270]|uniref:Uncharacterized protein n=1 Tax=Pisolithus tinctorius Marx 270 TaxID=870435 RepID=A0A0C3K0E3_PISTI|nr:hypothetical protein M404DRAFT_189202 [Pisolithus tinctorius Marx 270]
MAHPLSTESMRPSRIKSTAGLARRNFSSMSRQQESASVRPTRPHFQQRRPSVWRCRDCLYRPNVVLVSTSRPDMGNTTHSIVKEELSRWTDEEDRLRSTRFDLC